MLQNITLFIPCTVKKNIFKIPIIGYSLHFPTIDDEVKESNVNVYSFLLRDFDKAVFNAEVNVVRPHNYSDALRLQQQYNNTKLARDLRNSHLSAAIDARLKQINNNAIMARELQKGSPKPKKTLKERRKEERKLRKSKSFSIKLQD